MIDKSVNLTEISKAIDMLTSSGHPFEVRILASTKVTYSGVFVGIEELLKALENRELNGCNIYVTLQELDEACASRGNRGTFIKNFNPTTSDSDIEGYRWLFIDIDPCRPAGVSSSDAELKYAELKMVDILGYLNRFGFPRPIRAMSGNGYHLLYRISASKDKSSIIENCLKALALQFSDDHVDVDQKVFNPSRICKLYGTMAQKGTSTDERPHRMAKILDDWFEAQKVSSASLQALADTLPKEITEYKPYNNYNPGSFDIEKWLNKHHIGYKHGGTWQNCEKFILDHCPFDHSHKGKDAMILKSKNGPIAFRCFHNSCADKHWQDVRMLFEPNAYEKRQYDLDKHIENGWREHNRAKQQTAPEAAEDSNEPVWENLMYILNKPTPEREYILTGITEFDKNVGGLAKGVVSVLSGLRGAGKSNLLEQISLNAVNYGQKVLFYSGELKDKNYSERIFREAAGNDDRFLVRSGKYRQFVSATNEVKFKVATWLKDNLLLYNNDYGSYANDIIARIEQRTGQEKADLVILDNLMMMDINGLGLPNNTIYEKQKELMKALKRTAEKLNVHIMLVAHPRKPNGFLRLHDISGTGDIGNIADMVMIIHRHNTDFCNGYRDYFRVKENEKDPLRRRLADYDDEMGGVIEICKDRENGTVDYFIPLIFEPGSKRYCNYKGENVVYKWLEDEFRQEEQQAHEDSEEDSPV